MTTQLASKFVFRFLALNLAVAVLLGACSKHERVDPQTATPAEYELKDVRYFFDTGDRIDTTTVPLKGLSVQNPGNTLSTQQVEGNFDELVKTSQFEIDQTNTLPRDVALSKLELSVPQHGYGDGSFDYSTEKFPLSANLQQKPYALGQKEVYTIKIPAKSRIDISRQIDAYQLQCSFQGVLENKSTGQRYTLTGKWKGLLSYNNPTTTLKETPL